MSFKIRPRERESLIQALKAGVVPRIGQHLIQVGRTLEVASMLKDVELVADGGSSFRLVVGEYGSGKSFFINLVKNIALEKRFVTIQADLNPNRRLLGSSGQARSLYNELTKNMSTKMCSDGGAMGAIVEKFISQAIEDSNNSGETVENIINKKLSPLTEMVNGFDFTTVIKAYYTGFETGNEALKQDAIRWLRGEFSSKQDAKKILNVRNIVDDDTIYDQMKLLSVFVQLAGYAGLFVFLDEMVNLYKLSNTISRNNNYEQILRILNDVLQGNVKGLGFLLGGTPEFLTDTRRGLYSYEALQSRLSENQYAKNGLVDFSGPVIRLNSMSPEEFYVLINNILNVYAYGDPKNHLVPEEALQAFMEISSSRLGSGYFKTPRTTITSFVNFLSILEQNPGKSWKEVLNCNVDFKKESTNDIDITDEDDEFASFSL